MDPYRWLHVVWYKNLISFSQLYSCICVPIHVCKRKTITRVMKTTTTTQNNKLRVSLLDWQTFATTWFMVSLFVTHISWQLDMGRANLDSCWYCIGHYRIWTGWGRISFGPGHYQVQSLLDWVKYKTIEEIGISSFVMFAVRRIMSRITLIVLVLTFRLVFMYCMTLLGVVKTFDLWYYGSGYSPFDGYLAIFINNKACLDPVKTPPLFLTAKTRKVQNNNFFSFDV